MYSLDKYQNRAVYSKNRNNLVIASPGSGKTTVIINRVLHLIKDLKISPNNIVVITFTRASALDMKNRYILLKKNIKTYLILEHFMHSFMEYWKII